MLEVSKLEGGVMECYENIYLSWPHRIRRSFSLDFDQVSTLFQACLFSIYKIRA